MLEFDTHLLCLIQLVSCSVACADSDLRGTAEPFAKGFCHHFALLFALGYGATNLSRSHFHEVSSAGLYLGPMKELDITLFLDALINVLCSDDMKHSKMGEQALMWFMEMLLELHPSAFPASGSPILTDVPGGASDPKRKVLSQS